MKLRVTLKDPDALHEAVEEAVRKSLADLGLEEDELGPLVEKRCEIGRGKGYSEAQEDLVLRAMISCVDPMTGDIRISRAAMHAAHNKPFEWAINRLAALDADEAEPK